MNKKCLGSDFDDFLYEHGMLATAKSIAILCVCLPDFKFDGEEKTDKTEMAKRVNISRVPLNHLLDPANKSVTLETLENTTSVFNK